MKSLLNKLLAVGGIALLMLSASCKKSDQVITATSGSPGQLSATATTLVLNSTKASDPTIVETFNFLQANFGYNAAVTNTLQIDAPSDNWANPYPVSLGADVFTQGFNTNDFNAILLKAGVKGNVSGPVNIRMKSAIGANTFVYSNVLTLTVTPYNLKSWLYVAGAYEGWNNPGPQEDSLYSAVSNGIYVGIINFTAGNNQFLVLPAKNWNNKYATNDAQNATSSTITYNGPNNFYAPATPGQYIVTFNLNTNTISFALANYYSLIGSAPPGTAWATDTDMKYLNDGTSTWTTAPPVAMAVGQFKIRENHDWTYSWGDIATPDGTDATDNNGGNINIATAKTYTVNFTIPLTAQSPSFVPSVLATYSVK